jgi:SAM-dependent methyltransferase
MPISDRRSHWDGVYAGKADEELSWFQAAPGTSLELIARSGARPTWKIIDVGGGTSRLVDALLDRGFGAVTVLDISATALVRAKARLGERGSSVVWVTADVTAWTPVGRYDLWHDRAVFHFLTEAKDKEAYVAALKAGVGEGGQIIIGTFALDGPERCSGLPVCRYDADGLAAALGTGFRLLETLPEVHVTPAGTAQRFQYSRFVRV